MRLFAGEAAGLADLALLGDGNDHGIGSPRLIALLNAPYSTPESAPPGQHHLCPVPNGGFDLELVAEALCAAESQTQPRSACIAIGHRQRQVYDTRPPVLEDEAQTAPDTLANALQQ